jgi:glucose/arabinose dehydrogenase
MIRKFPWLPVALCALSFHADAAVTARLVADGFNSPIFAAAPAGSPLLYVAEQGGAIAVLDPATGRVNNTAFLRVPSIVSGGEQGLLGLAFHPNFAANGYFYVNVTRSSDGATEIRRYHATSATAADASSGTVILTYAQPFANHNGGWIAFGPDGFLYIAAGDGGSGNDPGNRAQNTGVLLGKILRIDVDHPAGGRNYGIPSGNPFAAGGGAPEVWDYGLRNPWRNSFDRTTGDLWIGDVGQGAYEEIDFHRSTDPGGKNFGWRVYEGNSLTPGISDTPPANAVFPVKAYSHDLGQAVIGGYVCRDPSQDELAGLYIYGDEGSGRIWTFRPVNGAVTGFRERTAEITSEGGIPSLSSFAEDDSGRLYAISLAGAIYRIIGGVNGRPAVNAAGPAKIVTHARFIRLHGTASDDTKVRRILFSVSGTGRHGAIKAGARWSFRLALREGVNRVVIRAEDMSGALSKPEVVTVIRR